VGIVRKEQEGILRKGEKGQPRTFGKLESQEVGISPIGVGRRGGGFYRKARVEHVELISNGWICVRAVMKDYSLFCSIKATSAWPSVYRSTLGHDTSWDHMSKASSER
jgi:hypothetical protein